MRFTPVVAVFAAVGLVAGAADSIAERAHKLQFSSIVLDTHDDTTQRFFTKEFDLGKQNAEGHVDIPRMREGGMNAIFFSIWIDGKIMGAPAVVKALDQDRRSSRECPKVSERYCIGAHGSGCAEGSRTR